MNSRRPFSYFDNPMDMMDNDFDSMRSRMFSNWPEERTLSPRSNISPRINISPRSNISPREPLKTKVHQNYRSPKLSTSLSTSPQSYQYDLDPWEHEERSFGNGFFNRRPHIPHFSPLGSDYDIGSTRNNNSMLRKEDTHNDDIEHLEKAFNLCLDMREYAPHDINIKIKGHTLTVDAKSEVKTLSGTQMNDFSKTIHLPLKLDSSNLVSELGEDGMMRIFIKEPPTYHYLSNGNSQNSPSESDNSGCNGSNVLSPPGYYQQDIDAKSNSDLHSYSELVGKESKDKLIGPNDIICKDSGADVPIDPLMNVEIANDSNKKEKQQLEIPNDNT